MTDNTELEFELKDGSGDKDATTLKGKVGANCTALGIQLDGFSDYVSEDNKGIPIMLEKFEGKVYLRVYADINIEEPTHSIDMSGALNTAYVEEEEGLVVGDDRQLPPVKKIEKAQGLFDYPLDFAAWNTKEGAELIHSTTFKAAADKEAWLEAKYFEYLGTQLEVRNPD